MVLFLKERKNPNVGVINTMKEATLREQTHLEKFGLNQWFVFYSCSHQLFLLNIFLIPTDKWDPQCMLGVNTSFHCEDGF